MDVEKFLQFLAAARGQIAQAELAICGADSTTAEEALGRATQSITKARIENVRGTCFETSLTETLRIEGAQR
jgi:hypothetical protein